MVLGTLRLCHRLFLDLGSSVQAATYFSGRFDDELITLAGRLVDRPGTIAIDVGANIGHWSVPLVQRLRSVGGRLVAVEPIAANAERLGENLELNGLEDVVWIVEAALSERRENMDVSLREEFTEGSTTGTVPW